MEIQLVLLVGEEGRECGGLGDGRKKDPGKTVSDPFDPIARIEEVAQLELFQIVPME